MNIVENVSLKPYNTFGVDVKANYFAEVETVDEIKNTIEWASQNNQPLLLISGGSNMLLTKDWEGLALMLHLKGIEITKEDAEFAFVKVQSAENWHEFVLWTLKHNLGGLENLSLIPGKVGTAPIQNIGAYGVEIKDTMFELTAFDLHSEELRTFSNQECNFGYRDSVFKNEFKNRFLILDVTFKLTKKDHKLHTSYGAIKAELEKELISKPTIQDISKAIIEIRQSKLPDPMKIGNSGSFFKNPVLPLAQFEELKMKFPTISAYPSGDFVKVAAGWLIENAGWKGRRIGDAGVHEKQALVLVNYGNATGKEIFDLSQKIIEDVFLKYGIRLEREVNVI